MQHANVKLVYIHCIFLLLNKKRETRNVVAAAVLLLLYTQKILHKYEMNIKMTKR